MRPRSRGERRSLRTFPIVSLRPYLQPHTAHRMASLPEYARDASADDATIFHGREIRGVTGARGGVSMVIHLSLANGEDPEGWTSGEREDYAGWLSDRQRRWRDGNVFAEEGFAGFKVRSIHWSPYDRVRVVNADP
jgi:hypothetical protein